MEQILIQKMSNYYRDQQRAFRALHATLESASKQGQEVSLPALEYEFIKNYPVSPKALRKQIHLFAESRNYTIKGDYLVF